MPTLLPPPEVSFGGTSNPATGLLDSLTNSGARTLSIVLAWEESLGGLVTMALNTDWVGERIALGDAATAENVGAVTTFALAGMA